jgi:filamentous hemagglutinin family protein
LSSVNSKTFILSKLIALFLVGLVSSLSSTAFALPQDGQIVSGSGTITTPNATSLQVDQNTSNLIINWQSFSIGGAESVNFNQPSSSSIALNRVIGSDPSILLGKLTANGQIFISNGSGVFFGPGAKVDTHGLIATTMGISNQDFLNETYNFFQQDSITAVINEGNISATSYVGLLAPSVENRGTIEVNLGSIDLAAGKAATLDFSGDGLIQFEVTQAISGTVTDKDGNELQDRVSNTGLLQADGGRIRMTAQDAGDVIRHVVNMEGVVQANTVVEQEGEVYFTAGDVGRVNISGTVSVAGLNAGEKGGKVNILADFLYHLGAIIASGETEGGDVNIQANKIYQAGSINADGNVGKAGNIGIDFTQNYIAVEVASLSASSFESDGGTVSVNGGTTGRLFTSGSIQATGETGGEIDLFGEEVLLAAAQVDASGDSGGGIIHIGGDFQGQGELPKSSYTNVTSATTIKADARVDGDGGEVVVWSEDSTEFYGLISAKGGAVSGNGGRIEVSSKGDYRIGGTTDASAANGLAGSLLLDPKNIVVDDGSGTLPFFDLVDPNADGTQYGSTVVSLSNGNIVVTDFSDDFAGTNAGAVYLYNGATGALISTVTGAANDNIGTGPVVELSNGNFVVASTAFFNSGTAFAGAVTLVSGTLGTIVADSGTIVTTSNSLHGSTASDQLGSNGVQHFLMAILWCQARSGILNPAELLMLGR